MTGFEAVTNSERKGYQWLRCNTVVNILEVYLGIWNTQL